mmetsp:Transcript_8314/g.18597  ORF Transcript_8314/g.18597 Transcript_8314/m.18597 type:complete len:90 (-) Transcript_8314:83-352(-)|eukprot:CAMPEP_0178420914 /NCGR_PEP_ID=MMETSP0689_2-20121128/26381_1 /TAXON_ID=160604 /ORGANISM="Amphidinium massartii, Strain CS-259" /LENGTH=89 /DNA_ID=CAMNT_0020042417 /DNA_START=283 /DNA_END=552 /DNA_ORIENTATION=+
MNAWAKDQKVEGSMISFYGDTTGAFTRALGVEMNHPGPMRVLGNPRCKRHAMIVENNVIKKIFVAEGKDDPAGDDKPDVSLVENILANL